MPMRLDEGWNQIQFNLSDFTRRAYNTNYVETLRVQIHANCRIRRIYFSDRLYSEEELPPEFKLFLPIKRDKVDQNPGTNVEHIVQESDIQGDDVGFINGDGKETEIQMFVEEIPDESTEPVMTPTE